MHKIKLLALAGVALGAATLGGCGTTSTQLTSQVAAIEAEVQADANLVCGFIPTVATIASFIPGAGVVTTSAASIAEAVCTAVSKAPPVTVASARRRSVVNGAPVNVATVYVPGVGNVPISGQFTR